MHLRRKNDQPNLMVVEAEYTAVYQVAKARYDRDGKLSGIGFFKFLSDRDTNRKWRNVKQFRRCGAGDPFKINSKTVVCEFHFNDDEIKVSLGVGRKTLVRGTVPSVFEFKETVTPVKRKAPTIRNPEPIEESSESEFEDDIEESCVSEYADDIELHQEEDSCECCNKYLDEITQLKEKVAYLESENERLKSENEFNEEQRIYYESTRAFDYKNISKRPELFKKMTGFEKDVFNIMLEFLNVGENNENIKFYEPSKEKVTPAFDNIHFSISSELASSSSRKRGLN